MPPKQSKADLAKKQKVVEDKTFGLKNKNKSKNVQKYVQSLKQSVQPRPDASKLNAQVEHRFSLIDYDIFKPKVPVGVDPKSIVCEHFKVGQCAKGFKCKFSHDLNVQRKGEKIDIFSDKRDEDENGTMEDWDQETLEKVVASKSNEYNKNKPTDIIHNNHSGKCLSYGVSKKLFAMMSDKISAKVCKYFLEAVEKKQYGWFWACPNGGKECHYRHALPPGYVLKSQMKALLEEEANKISIEEEIENERAKVASSTPMTTDLFMQWKKKKIEARDESLAAQRAERAKNDRMRQVFFKVYSSEFAASCSSGRELFLSDASLFVDDAEAYDKYQRDEADADQKSQGQVNSNGSAHCSLLLMPIHFLDGKQIMT
ncbi:Zinc finger C-x8-C-x5-C-x3-H type family protein [Perilla frutescens var. hirtella]|nr:Zinc finger C-x8-C-x5-C-x3-H type family protein [Perilla frutescens var. hirtella]